jgi:hypothetical protein
MIHFLDFSNEKMVAKVPAIAAQVDVLLGNPAKAQKVRSPTFMRNHTHTRIPPRHIFPYLS